MTLEEIATLAGGALGVALFLVVYRFSIYRSAREREALSRESVEPVPPP